MESTASESCHRPSKVARLDSHRGPSATLSGMSASPAESVSQPPITSKPRFSRGPTACETCRNRKTKCDNRRPKCGYCIKVNNANCSYADESPELLGPDTVPQLLQAIEHLTNLLESASQQHQIPCSDVSLDASHPTGIFNQSSRTDAPISFHHHHHCYHDRGAVTSRNSRRSRSFDSGRKVASPAGLNYVLKWRSFPQPCPISIEVVDDPFNCDRTNSLPSIEISELSRLKTKFVAYVHIKNPILDLSILDVSISQVAENGFDWTTSSCLISLVCALGAMSEKYKFDRSEYQAQTEQSPESKDKDTNLAFRYWNIAVKRLGSVIGQSSLQSVQCLCLTGIWYMYNMQPLQGWKYFALASNTWYSTSISSSLSSTSMADSNDTENHQLLSLEQSLYFTCFKSESELVFELSLPKSVLESVDYPYTFPSPPHLDRQWAVADNDHIEKRSWYYYLAELASRYIMNRIMKSPQYNFIDSSPRGIERLLEELEVFESEIKDWYLSLPPSITFAFPTGTIQPLEDELSQLLRARYLSSRELCYRPFVQLAVNYHLDIHPQLLSKVATIASQGLQFCTYRLQAVPPQARHHGLWFQLPNTTTCSLILLAADRAHDDPTLNAMPEIQMPSGWREEILVTRDLLGKYWKDKKGGIWECFGILDWALDGCKTGY